MRLNRSILFLILVASCLGNSEVWRESGSLWRRARTLPTGQRVWSFQALPQQIMKRFGSDGHLEPLRQSYSHGLSWKELVQADQVHQEAVREYMRASRVSENDIAATATYEIKSDELGMQADWAFGLTDIWMIGLRVPLTYRHTKVASQVQMSPALAQGSRTPDQQRSILGLSKPEMRARLKSLANEQLTQEGYDGVPAQRTEWAWGDMSLLSQIRLFDNYRWTWSLQQLARVPTSRNPSAADFLRSSRDDGQLDLGLTSMLDYRRRDWTFGWRLAYVMQTPDSIRRHTADQSSDIDPKVHRDLGDYAWTSWDTEWHFNRRLTFNAEYSYLRKSRDRYVGESSDGKDYASLGEGSDQELHQAQIGILYQLGDNLIHDGRANKWVASLGYTYPIAGRNSAEASRAGLEIINYF